MMVLRYVKTDESLSIVYVVVYFQIGQRPNLLRKSLA